METQTINLINLVNNYFSCGAKQETQSNFYAHCIFLSILQIQRNEFIIDVTTGYDSHAFVLPKCTLLAGEKAAEREVF